MTKSVRIGTRGSQLALWQANEVARLLGGRGYASEIVTFKTTGDKRTDVALASIGGKGVFIKELEEALDRGAIDIAVHSLKDVPSIIPDRFCLAGFLERADPRDAWVQPDGKSIDDMADGALIGTSAPRRRAQLRVLHPRLKVADMRGNVDTRINKVRSGHYAAAVLASAGLTRLGRASEITSYFSPDVMLPAAGQGIVGIETLGSHAFGREAAAAITHAPSALAAKCERGVLQQFGELLDCYSAVAVHATVTPDIHIRAFFADLEGTRHIRSEARGGDPDEVIAEVAASLRAQGAMELLQTAGAR